MPLPFAHHNRVFAQAAFATWPRNATIDSDKKGRRSRLSITRLYPEEKYHDETSFDLYGFAFCRNRSASSAKGAAAEPASHGDRYCRRQDNHHQLQFATREGPRRQDLYQGWPDRQEW